MGQRVVVALACVWCRARVPQFPPLPRPHDGVFKVLEPQEKIAQAGLDEVLETIVWPGGLDLAPEFVYFQAFKDKPQYQDQFKDPLHNSGAAVAVGSGWAARRLFEANSGAIGEKSDERAPESG